MTQQAQTATPGTGYGAVGRSALDADDSLKAERAPLVSGDLMAWLALRRVHEGGVTLLEDSYYHHGHALPHYLNAPLTELLNAEQLVLAEADPHTAGMQQVRFTQEGQDLYAVLCGKRGVRLDPSVCRCS